MRNLVKEPLTEAELTRLAGRVGGARLLVAPKRKTEAESIPDGKLIAWLAADGGRVRRPIIVAGDTTTLGFTGAAREELEGAL